MLEIGCGTGLNFGLLTGKLATVQGGRLTGVDFSGDMLARARRRVTRRRWRHVELVQADAARLDLRRQFDAILFGYSLSMIVDWRAALARAAAHLAPGGRLAVLDFGDFGAWGPAGRLMRAWLRLNHVATGRPYESAVRDMVGSCACRERLGGYYFVAVGRSAG